MLLSLEHGLWAPNLHFHNPNPDIPELHNGQLRVVDQPLPVQGGIVGINSFGFGGSNVHVILQPHLQPAPAPAPHASLPRLLVSSGRTPKAVQGLLEQGLQHSQDLAFLSMLNSIAATPMGTMPWRGYTVLGAQDSSQEVQQVPPGKRPLWFICSGEPLARSLGGWCRRWSAYQLTGPLLAGMGSQWCGMGKSLMRLDTFRNSILKSDEAVKPFGMKVSDLLMSTDENIFDDMILTFVSLTAIHVGALRTW